LNNTPAATEDEEDVRMIMSAECVGSEGGVHVLLNPLRLSGN
jgi:hypothetical protein